MAGQLLWRLQLAQDSLVARPLSCVNIQQQGITARLDPMDPKCLFLQSLTFASSHIEAFPLNADCRVHGGLLHDVANKGRLCTLYGLICMQHKS